MDPEPTVLTLRSTGPAVERLQRLLNDVTGAGLVVDGAFGPATEAAVRAVQREAGLLVDGVADPATLAVLG